MTLDELREILRVQLPPMGELAQIAGLIVSCDVWAKLTAEIPRSDVLSPFIWSVVVDPWLPRGCIMPVDKDGKPVLKPPVASLKESDAAPDQSLCALCVEGGWDGEGRVCPGCDPHAASGGSPS